MSYYLYVLKNSNGKHYIGISSNIMRRLRVHNAGKVRSTRAYRPWIMVYKERCNNRVEARRREIELKTNYTKRSIIFSKY